MTFYADLHIHSKHSRATSGDCNLAELAYWARRKGITLLGTGDFTHPAWLKDIRETLVPAEPGLFRLNDPLDKATQKRLPVSCQGPVRFALQVEISTIYKKGDRTRKVHHLIFAPDLDSADRLIAKLSRIGNLKSDGRPILGLDSRDLLEITLESGDGAFLIPAHIWTPWFSVLGSKSGFDAIEDCYGDLARHVFAVETGLSSDPLMNWRVSSLDRYRLVSNSDAHSPSKLGREACVFDTELSYVAVRRALETGAGYGGTVEFFPEEGKYHLDGHRQCEVRLTPEETKKHKGRCPVCGKPVTVGVMSRVDELADRAEGARPKGAAAFRSFIPLAEVMGEIFGVGPDSKKARAAYDSLLTRLGGELHILEHVPLEEIRRACSPVFAEAIERMRQGRVIREAGYDGEYGVIRVFREGELKGDKGTGFLFEMEAGRERTEKKRSDGRGQKSEIRGQTAEVRSRTAEEKRQRSEGGRQRAEEKRRKGKVKEAPADYGEQAAGMLAGLDPDQRAAAEITEGPLAIIAGPGTGKTRTLTHRIAYLAADRGVPLEQCLAITFTRRAAGEMKERLEKLLPGKADVIPVMTFHSLGFSIIREHAGQLGLKSPVRVAGEGERIRLLADSLSISESKAGRLLSRLSDARRSGQEKTSGEDLARAEETYSRRMKELSLLDFDDLIRLPAQLLSRDTHLQEQYRRRWRWVSVDEFQDIDQRQYDLVRLLVPSDGNLCVIGDPDQAIYGFRGTDSRFFGQFRRDFPAARAAQLSRNYRSGRMIVEGSAQVIAPATAAPERRLEALLEDDTRIAIHESATDRAEAEFVVHTVEKLIGGSTFFSMDSGRVKAGEGEALSFSDFAVLYRTDAQADVLVEAFSRSGMPFQKRSHDCLADSPLVRELTAAVRGMPEGGVLAEKLEQAAAAFEGEKQKEARLILPALRALAERQDTMEGFLSELALGVDVDLWDPRAESVSLLTLHAAKGLEFPVVFIVGCEDGLLPLYWGSGEDCDRDEERRLFFVGMTRARTRLFLCHARRRMWRGAVRDMAVSPFIADIRDEMLERMKTESARKRSKPTGEQLNLF